MDVLSKSQRSYCMSRIRSRHTLPEKVVREILRSLGIRYRLDSTLLGRPDIKLVGQKAVIFVDGCFWHGCPRHFKVPSGNREFWLDKIKKNVERDRKVDSLLRRAGYKVIRIWEHQAKNPSRLALQLGVKLAVLPK